MAYTAISTFADSSVTAALLNASIRDNQLAIKDPPSGNHESNEASNYTMNTTTPTNIDTVDWTKTIVTTGGDVFLGLTANGVSAGSRGAIIEVYIDSATQTIISSIFNSTSKTVPHPIPCVYLIQGLSAGSHTFTIRWYLSIGTSLNTIYAGAGTASYDVHPQFWVRELS
jgi:hypothetical protein